MATTTKWKWRVDEEMEMGMGIEMEMEMAAVLHLGSASWRSAWRCRGPRRCTQAAWSSSCCCLLHFAKRLFLHISARSSQITLSLLHTSTLSHIHTFTHPHIHTSTHSAHSTTYRKSAQKPTMTISKPLTQNRSKTFKASGKFSKSNQPKTKSSKNRIRDLKRLLSRPNLVESVRVEKEKQLKELEKVHEEHLKLEKKKKISAKYKNVRFFGKLFRCLTKMVLVLGWYIVSWRW